MNRSTSTLLAPLSLFAAVSLTAPSAHAQNLLVNGNFQAGAQNNTLPGWSITPGSFSGVTFVPQHNSYAAWVYNTARANLWQTFDTVPGNTYQLEVFMWAETFGGGWTSINVDGRDPFWWGFLTNAPSRNWFRYDFVATGTTTTLNLEFRTPAVGVMYIANASVIDITIPSPGAAALLGLGGLIATRRRRRCGPACA